MMYEAELIKYPYSFAPGTMWRSRGKCNVGKYRLYSFFNPGPSVPQSNTLPIRPSQLQKKSVSHVKVRDV